MGVGRRRGRRRRRTLRIRGCDEYEMEFEILKSDLASMVERVW